MNGETQAAAPPPSFLVPRFAGQRRPKPFRALQKECYENRPAPFRVMGLNPSGADVVERASSFSAGAKFSKICFCANAPLKAGLGWDGFVIRIEVQGQGQRYMVQG